MAFSRKSRNAQRKQREIARNVRKNIPDWIKRGFDSEEEFNSWNTALLGPTKDQETYQQ
jgi:hypothetical protein